jgi:ketosteroid isomerase-like protein
MSEENVKIVRKAFDTYNAFMRGELTEEDVAEHELLDPQIEFHWHDERVPDAPERVRGARGLAELLEQYRAAWVELAWEPLEFVEAPEDRVVTPIRQRGQGLGSGGPIEAHFFYVWTIRGGKVRKTELFRHRADALEAAGLSG